MARLTRTVNATRPAEVGRHEGLAYTLWQPTDAARGGVVILHGAGSCKESHHDFARRLIVSGFAAVCFDQRGHGESDGPMDGRALEDVRTIASLLPAGVPLALRGSSMGGCFAILAAPLVQAAAVVAICPGACGPATRTERGGFAFEADAPAIDALLTELDLDNEIASLEVPVLLLHAAADEQVPVEHSRELARGLRSPASRLIVVPGGHHRSVQHDAELQAVSVKFLERALALAAAD